MDGDERRTANKQVIHARHAGCREVTHVNGHQVGATVEHVVHILQLGRTEAAQVKARQASTAVEHAAHVLHIRSIQVLDARNRRQVSTVAEPVGGIAQLGIVSKRRVKHNVGNLTALTAPRLVVGIAERA